MTAVSCSQDEMTESVNMTIHATFPDALESKVSLTEKGDDTGLSLGSSQIDLSLLENRLKLTL